MNSIITSITRLSLQGGFVKPYLAKNVATTAAARFNMSPCLYAEPLKKKKRIDPQVVKAREDRKRKKLEKQIRRLEKNARQLKPIDELEVPLNLIDERKQRFREYEHPDVIELEQRILLEKLWAKYKRDQYLGEVRMIEKVISNQQKTLDELRCVSRELYNEALQADSSLTPYNSRGAVQTPPLRSYDGPDGDYNDVSRRWE